MRSIVDLNSAPKADPAPAESRPILGISQSRPFRATPRIAAEVLGAREHGPDAEGIYAQGTAERTNREAPLAISLATGTTRAAMADTAPSTSGNDFELVLGRRQIASCLFAGTVLIAIFAAGAYFAGKMSTPSCAAAASLPSTTPASATAHAASPMSKRTETARKAALPVATIKQTGFPFVASQTNPASETTNASDDSSPEAGLNAAPSAGGVPLFASPQPGILYLQIGALDRTTSTIVAQGLRERGYRSFVAPGPSEKIYRVLVGPFANQEEYKRTKAETDVIDVNAIAYAALAKRTLARSN